MNSKQMVRMKPCIIREHQHQHSLIFFSEGLPVGVIVSDFSSKDLNYYEDSDSEEYFSADEEFVDLTSIKPQLIQTVDVATQTDPYLTSCFELCHVL